jgi:phosphoglycolate phosphatase
MNIIFDLDGTLIDSKMRLYKLFQNLTRDTSLSYDQYWKLKKSKVSNEIILKTQLDHDDERIKKFTSDWMVLIESPDYLSFDKNFDGVHDTLLKLQKIATLHVCTARQHRQPVISQLSELKLLSFFDKVIVTEQVKSKEYLIAKHIKDIGPLDWIVGDTGKDIQAGKFLGLKTCGVLSGFMNLESLQAYKPDMVMNSVSDLKLSILKDFND